MARSQEVEFPFHQTFSARRKNSIEEKSQRGRGIVLTSWLMLFGDGLFVGVKEPRLVKTVSTARRKKVDFHTHTKRSDIGGFGFSGGGRMW